MQMLVNIVLLCILFDNEIIYVHSFGAEHIPEEIEILMENNNIKTKKERKENNSIMCGYFSLDLLILCLHVKL